MAAYDHPVGKSENPARFAADAVNGTAVRISITAITAAKMLLSFLMLFILSYCVTLRVGTDRKRISVHHTDYTTYI